jgi:hypothetical protein
MQGFPSIQGYLRVVDYEYTPILSQLHKLNVVLTQGSFFENNPIKSDYFVEWDNETEYFNYLSEDNVSHVLFCKYCIQRTNEYYLFNNSMKVWQNDYYTLLEVGKV